MALARSAGQPLLRFSELLAVFVPTGNHIYVRTDLRAVNIEAAKQFIVRTWPNALGMDTIYAQNEGKDGAVEAKIVDPESTPGYTGLLCLLRCLNTKVDKTRYIDANERSAILEDLCSPSGRDRPLTRKSLFEHMPPTVVFYRREKKVPDFAVKKPPARYKSVFRWCQTSLLPNLMKRTLRSSHYELVAEDADWRGYWGKHLHSNQYRTLTYWQKVNHFPGDFHLGRKDRLWMHLCELSERFDGFDIMPYTYILPRDYAQLTDYIERSKKHVILKPPASARGRGINIIAKVADVPLNTPLIAQHYIESPLVVNGAKFDLRIYVYVASLDPLRIYINRDGLARFASVAYAADHSFHNQYMHLTNFSINKFAARNGITNGTPELKWRLDRFWEFVRAQGRDPAHLWDRIKDVAVRAVVACAENIRKQQDIYSAYPFLNREVFGMDILVDSEYKPWILEMNISPSMQAATDSDVAVKAPMLADLMNMWRMEMTLEDDPEEVDLSYRTKPIDEHKSKVHLLKEAEMLDFYDRTGKISPAILTELTDADLRYLIDFEDEFQLKGGFDLIFPHPDTVATYLPCAAPTYATLLLTAWCSLSEAEREKGRKRVQKMAQAGAHLANSSQRRDPSAESASSNDHSPDADSV